MAPHFGRFLRDAVVKRGGPTFVARELLKNAISDQSLRRYYSFEHFAEAKMYASTAHRLADALGFPSLDAFIHAADTTPMPVPRELTAPQRQSLHETAAITASALTSLLNILDEPLPLPTLVRLVDQLSPGDRAELLRQLSAPAVAGKAGREDDEPPATAGGINLGPKTPGPNYDPMRGAAKSDKPRPRNTRKRKPKE